VIVFIEQQLKIRDAFIFSDKKLSFLRLFKWRYGKTDLRGGGINQDGLEWNRRKYGEAPN